MQPSSSIAALAFAMTALAKPVADQCVKRAPAPAAGSAESGKDTNGSIFQFGSPSNCRNSFWQSGACGLSTYFKDKVDAQMPLVALPSGVFDKHGQAQNNKLCGKTITITHNGVTQRAVVADENMSNEQSIDMCLDMWEKFGGRDNDGTLLKGLEWSIEA